MAQLLTPETFEFFAQYLLAGFIIYSIRSRYVLGERPRQSEIFFEIIVLSLLNQFLFLLIVAISKPVFRTALTPENFEHLREGFAVYRFYLEILALPALLGLVFGRNLQNGWNEGVLRRLSMPVVQPTRRAYDHLFGEVAEPGFMIVTFDDGTIIHGYYGQNSFAGSDPQKGDLLLERLYTVEEDGTWIETKPPRVALLNTNGLRTIELIAVGQEDENGE